MPDAGKMEAAVHAYVEALTTGNAAALVALFADGATVEDPVGSEPLVGKEAVRAFYTGAVQSGGRFLLEGPVRICGPYAAFAFRFETNSAGKEQHVDVIDTFRFDDNEKIVEMRAYFGPTNMHGFD